MNEEQQNRFAEEQIEQARAYTFTERCKAFMYVAFGVTALAAGTVAVVS